MKKYNLLLVCLAFSLVAMSQAVISFDEKIHDFGKVNEEDGKITYVFSFINKGNSPLVINRVQASCGCTTPTWSKEPIEPGKKGSITVTYNPEGRPGVFTKTITVYSNATDEELTLTIKGEVIPKLRDLEYSVYFGGLMTKSKIVQMNNVDKGKIQTSTLEIQNPTKTPLKPTFENLPAYLTYSVSPETLKSGEVGKITFTFNSKNCAQWGPIMDEVYVIVNGVKQYSEENKLLVASNVVEDFSRLTLDQKRKAPILEIPVRTINIGTLKPGAKRVGKFKLSNKGQNALEVRRIINSNYELAISPAKLSIAGGKNANIIVTINSKNLAEGDYKKSFTVQTNDPENSFVILILNWRVQK